MRYRLFLSDYDGTLAGADGRVSRENIDAIAAYRRAGGIFAVCTGRMLPSILPRLKEMGLDEGYVAALQGGQIADIATGELVSDEAFPEADAIDILHALEKMDLHIHIYAGMRFYSGRDDEYLRAYEKFVGVRGTVCEGSLADMVSANHLRVVKILVMTEPCASADLCALFAAMFPEKCYVARSSDVLVELMPPQLTKAAAVRFLAARYNIPTSEIAAIGDRENDGPMLGAVGGKFAVANAASALKTGATVVPSCDEDGVAYAIRNYAMGESV